MTLNEQALSAMAERVDTLRDLLRVEFLRHDHLELPWKCVEADCPRFGKSLYLTGCNCLEDFKRQHIAAVRKALDIL